MLFDTTFLIDLQRETLRRTPARACAFLRSNPSTPMRISAVTVGEVAEGFEPGQNDALEEMLRRYEVIELTAATARLYGQVSRRLRAGGEPIGDNDLWIAATALEHGLALVTRDRSHFERIQGLDVVVY